MGADKHMSVTSSNHSKFSQLKFRNYALNFPCEADAILYFLQHVSIKYRPT
jgi:hypothetical protein